MLLQVQDLRTAFAGPDGVASVVDGVCLDVPRGQTVALVGESGCGKSVTALSIMRLVPSPGRIVRGEVFLAGCDLLKLDGRRMRSIRGDRIAMISQEPMTSLNPVLSVGEQIAEALGLNGKLRGKALRGRTVELLRRVGIPAPEHRLRDYPHQMSGGMRQRVIIAMALAREPELLIADEPTTALDVTVQAQVVDLLRDLQQQTGMSILLITHDLGLVAGSADTVCVMYAGRIVERAPVNALLTDPRHPYTQALLRSVPRLSTEKRFGHGGARRRLEVIPGEVPQPAHRPLGCAFHPRCPLGREDPDCRTFCPEMAQLATEHECACWKAGGYPFPSEPP
jgi:oligopeptide/dipeptide ABC transporter ATP-binding protein